MVAGVGRCIVKTDIPLTRLMALRGAICCRCWGCWRPRCCGSSAVRCPPVRPGLTRWCGYAVRRGRAICISLHGRATLTVPPLVYHHLERLTTEAQWEQVQVLPLPALDERTET